MIKIILRLLTISLSHNQWFRRIWCLHTIHTIGMIHKAIHIGLTTTRATIPTSMRRQVVHDLKHRNLPHSHIHPQCRHRPRPTSCPIPLLRLPTSGIHLPSWAFDRFPHRAKQRHACPRTSDGRKRQQMRLSIEIDALWVVRRPVVSTRSHLPLRRRRIAINIARWKSRW